MYLSYTSALLIILPLLSFAADLNARAACTGAQQDGYCCQGVILPKDHNSGYNAEDLICCQGDSSTAINLGPSAPTSCTAGTQIPLTEAGGASQSTATSAANESGPTASSSTTTETSSANDAAKAMITAGPWVGAVALAGGMIYAM